MEAAGAISKRRRIGRGVGADRISALPDAVLGEIVSLLPTLDGARTQILASRWRHIWRSAPLNLDLMNFGTRGFAGRVRRILSSHQGPGRRLRVSAWYVEKPSDPANTRSAVVDSWLCFPALDNLEEIDLWYTSENPVHSLSPSIARFSATLRVVSIGDCNLSDSTVQGLCFPKLTRLTLHRVTISECSMSHMIAGCPALECLNISRSFGFRCLRINSLSHTIIGVWADCFGLNKIQCREFIIENAPRLKKLLHQDQHSHSTEELYVSVLSAPKLETLRCVLDKDYLSTKLSFGSTIVQVLQPCRTSVKKLWRRKYRNLARCLDIRLKTIMLNSYRGSTSEVNFFTFFVLNAKSLESVTLLVRDKSEEFIAKQSRKLQLENGASRGVQFHFTTRIGVSYLADVQCA